MLFIRGIRFHDAFELIESIVPHIAERLQEVGDLPDLLRIEAIMDFPAGWLLFEQGALGKDLEVFGNGRSRRVEIGGDGAGGHGLGSEEQENGPPRRIGDGLEYIASCLHCVVVWLQIYA